MRHKIFTFIDFFLIIIYLGLGLYFIFYPSQNGILAPNMQLMFGIILVAYGLFRLIRAYNRIKRRYDE